MLLGGVHHNVMGYNLCGNTVLIEGNTWKFIVVKLR